MEHAAVRIRRIATHHALTDVLTWLRRVREVTLTRPLGPLQQIETRCPFPSPTRHAAGRSQDLPEIGTIGPHSLSRPPIRSFIRAVGFGTGQNRPITEAHRSRGVDRHVRVVVAQTGRSAAAFHSQIQVPGFARSVTIYQRPASVKPSPDRSRHSRFGCSLIPAEAQRSQSHPP